MSKKNKKSKVVVKKLRYSWFTNSVFFCLTVLIPIVLIFIEGYKAPNTTTGTIFKVSFTGLSIGLITWIIISKTFLKNYKTKLLARQSALEHDYSTENGNIEKIRLMWYRNERVLTIFSLVSVILTGGLISIILLGVSYAFITISNTIILIVGLYALAYTIKFIALIIPGGDEDDE